MLPRVFARAAADARSAGQKKVDKYGRKLERRSKGDEGKAAVRNFVGFVDRARGQGLDESSDESSESDSDDDDDDASLGAGASSDSGESDEESEQEVELGARARRRRRSSTPEIDLSEGEPAQADDDDDAESDDEGETQDPSRRIALVNLDWDHLRAVDLFRVLTSPLSSSSTTAKASVVSDSGKLSFARGRLLNVRIYPSQFGRERMAREEHEGPPPEAFQQRRRRRKHITERDLVDEQVNDGDEYDNEALRRYELERLRYFYAVATFDSSAAAAHVFAQLNGAEFERTANVLDLRFVPDETSFDDDPVHDEATPADLGAAYKALDFSTDALRSSRVKLSWDADDPHRRSKMRELMRLKDPNSVEDDAIRAYVASDSDDDDDAADDGEEERDDFFDAGESAAGGGDKRRGKLRALLGLEGGALDANAVDWNGKRRPGKGDMQITFAPALTDEAAARPDETSIETYKRKEKERRERKRAERDARRAEQERAAAAPTAPTAPDDDDGGGDDNDDAENHFDMREILRHERQQQQGKIKKRNRRKARPADEPVAADDFSVNTGDDRFSRLFQDPEFAIDPSNPKCVVLLVVPFSTS